MNRPLFVSAFLDSSAAAFCSGGRGNAMMRTLPFYISRHYLAAFLLILGALLGIVFIFDVIELLRRTAVKDASERK